MKLGLHLPLCALWNMWLEVQPALAIHNSIWCSDFIWRMAQIFLNNGRMPSLVELWTWHESLLAGCCHVELAHFYSAVSALPNSLWVSSPTEVSQLMIFSHVGAQMVRVVHCWEALICRLRLLHGNLDQFLWPLTIGFWYLYITFCKSIRLMMVWTCCNVHNAKMTHCLFELVTCVTWSVIRYQCLLYPKFTDDGLHVFSYHLCSHVT